MVDGIREILQWLSSTMVPCLRPDTLIWGIPVHMGGCPGPSGYRRTGLFDHRAIAERWDIAYGREQRKLALHVLSWFAVPLEDAG